MSPVIYAAGAVLGLAFGSFINVVISRVPAGGSIITPPSSCPECGTRIRWYMNIPLLSYILLRGKCSSCGVRISPVYPAVETAGAVMAILCLRYFGLTLETLFIYPFVMSLTAVTIIDWRHRIIPDSISLPFILFGMLYAVFGERLGITDSLLGAAAGGGTLFLVGFLYRNIKNVDGIGGGDIKLMAMVGAFLGVKLVLLVIFIASFAGTVYSVFLIRRGADGLTAVPFGSFLAPAAVICLFAGNNMIHWYLSIC
jgi:leader peptidase (prepilin peptidase)/N-methyltransferase